MLELLFHSFYRTVKDLLPFVHQYNVVADLFYLLHPVCTENYRSAIAGQGKYFILYYIAVHRIQSAEWFIKYDQAWVCNTVVTN